MTMEKLPMDAEYRDIVVKAKELGLPYVGVKKNELLEMVNDKIEKINSGVIEESPVEQNEEVAIENTIGEVETPAGETETSEVTSQETTKEEAKKQARQPRVKSPKWFEELGAFPYKEGDIVQIVSGKDLIGRKVYVKQPSAKRNALKGHLIHPVTGGLQKTLLSIDFDRVVLIERDGKPVEQNSENQQNEEQAM